MRVAVALVCALVVSTASIELASADAKTVRRLSKTLQKAKSPKARISAAVALAKLKDKRATPALVKALRDKSSGVRAIAATALGHLGDRRALPALRKAKRDKSDKVRRRAEAAVTRLEKAAPKTASKNKRALSRVRVDAQEAPRAKAAKPELHVVVKSTADKSKGRVKGVVRKRRAKAMKRLMIEEMGDTGSVTMEKTEAARLGLESFAVDASIVKFNRKTRGKWVEVECQIRLTISNDRGKMISFLTGGAKVQVAKRTFNRTQLRQMRSDALENAVRNVYRDLLSFLKKRS